MTADSRLDHLVPAEPRLMDVSGYYEELVPDSTLDHLVPAEQRHEPSALQSTGAPLPVTLLTAQSSSTLTTDLFMLDTEQLLNPIVPESLSCTVLPPFTEPEVLDTWAGEAGDEDEFLDTRERVAAVRQLSREL